MCVICDILCFINGILWIFFDNFNDSDQSIFDLIDRIVNKVHFYETLWVYNIFVGICSIIVPSIGLALFCACYFALGVYVSESNMYYPKIIKIAILILLIPCVLSTSAMMIVYILLYLMLFSQITCLGWIGHLLDGLIGEKLGHHTRNDQLFWNYILSQLLNLQNRRLQIIATICHTLEEILIN